jgi:hypothetical protein
VWPTVIITYETLIYSNILKVELTQEELEDLIKDAKEKIKRVFNFVKYILSRISNIG